MSGPSCGPSRAASGTELEPEVRALVADTMEATAAATPSSMTWPSNAPPWPSLGIPGRSRARYTDRRCSSWPGALPEWRRLVTTLIGILVPIVAIVAGASSLVGESTVGQAIVSAWARARRSRSRPRSG